MIVARPGPEGIEVLMLRRAPASRFGAGFAVFPGGTVAPVDASLAARWFGSEEHVARACAIRELAEEAAVVSTREGPRPLDPGEEAEQAISADPPAPADIPQISRWIAPDFLEVRFDARFFAVGAPPDLVARPAEMEIDRAWWAAPAEVLRAHPLWESLMWPTYVTLRELERCSSVQDVLSLRMERNHDSLR